jgi:hypothetical protein
MVYTPYTWADNSSGGTPITAARLNALEQALASVSGYVNTGGSGTAPTSFTADAPPSAQIGTSYSYTFVASGGSPSPTYTLSSGSLPAGLSLASSGVLYGTPTTAGNSTFTVAATNASGTLTSSSTTITTSSTVTPPTSFGAASPTSGTVGTSYSYSFVANGTAPTYSVTSGTLPAGLTLSTAGLLSGTPTSAGTSTFVVTATNSGGSVATSSIGLVIAAQSGQVTAPTAFTVDSPPAANVGTAYSYSFAANGTSPTYSVGTGALPTGLTLSSSGLLSGTPTAVASSTFTVKASNTAGNVSTGSITIVVAANNGSGGGGGGTLTNLLADAIASVTGGSGAFTVASTLSNLPTLSITSNAFQGSTALLATANGSPSKYWIQPVTDYVQVTAGSYYTAACGYNASGANVVGFTQINWYDSNLNSLGYSANPGVQLAIGQGAWNTLSVVNQQAPTGAAYAAVQATVISDPNAGGTVAFDEWAFYAGSTAPASWSTGTGTLPVPPSAPTNVVGTPSAGQISVAFVPGATGGLPVTYTATITSV